MDEALTALYDGTGGFDYASDESKDAGRKTLSPNIARRLADIRTYFNDDLLGVIQSDAIEKYGIKKLLSEPETLSQIKPDLNLVTVLLALKNQIPEKTKETARAVVGQLTGELNRRLEGPLRRAVTGAVNRQTSSVIPNASGLDWKRTIRQNLKNYDPRLRRIVPERFYFFDRTRKRGKWTVIINMDQSGSMAGSVVYGSVIGCALSGMVSLKTHVVAFDTCVADLTELYGNDPVDMLFGIQLGGGTDISQSVSYCKKYISEPRRTLFILLSDLYEGGNQARMLAQMEEMAQSGVKVLVLTALSDHGAPAYNTETAKKLANIGIPCRACAPGQLPELLEKLLKH
jgi:Mg-chelatase subunit ChlD